MAKKDKKEEIPSWIKDLYKEDLDRVVRGERPMYFRGMNDGPLKNVSPEFDILSGGAAVKGMNGIRGALSPLNNGMGNYNFSIRGINKKIGELVDEAGLYLPEKLRPIYQTVVDAMSRSKDKGLGYITQPLANALYPADERRNRRLDGEHPVGYVDAIDGIWPREKYGLWGEKIERKAEGGPTGNDPMYVRQDVSDRALYLKDIIGNAVRRRLYKNVTPDVVASNASLPDKVKEFIYGRNGKANVDEYSEQLWGRFLSQPNSLDGNSKEIRIPDNIIADIERMFNRDTKDEINRLDKKIRDTEREIYGSDKPVTDDAYGRLEFLKKSREWVDIFEKNRNSVRSGKPTVFSEYDFYPEAAGELTPLSGFGNFTIYRRPDGRLGVYDVYDFYSNDQEFPINIATKVLDAIGDKFEERGSFKDYNPAPESGRDALIRNAIMSKNKLEDKAEGGRINTGSDYGSGKYVIDPRRSENNKMAVYDEIWDYLTEKKGIPQTQAIGILSNIAAESGGDTEALGAAGDFGIQQWLGPRKKELQRRYGKKPTLTQQLDYLVDEYQGRVPGLGWSYMNQGKFFDKDAQGNIYNYYMYSKADFDNATNYKDATVAWNQGYGRPLGSTLRNEKRFEFADMFSNRYGVPENEPMRYEFGQRDSGTGDGGQQPVPETVAPAAPSLASHPAMDSWWEKEGQDLLYKMLAQSGANKKAIEDIANNIKNDPQSEAQIAEAERMRKEQAKRQLVLNMIPGLSLNIKGMSRTQN
nr:MAG TPA: tail tape measure [Caudoviricetes sp.]